jgi:hypothetical protein
MTERDPLSETSYYNKLKEMENSKILMILQLFLIKYGKAGIY